FYCDKCNQPRTYKPDKKVFFINKEDTECLECNKQCKPTVFTRTNVVKVELQDPDLFNEIEQLPVFLFDKDTINIGIGEHVTIDGEVFIHSTNGTDKGKLFTYFYAESIKYENRKDIVLTAQDITTNEKFRNKIGTKDIIPKLVQMFDPEIIGHEVVKEGILLAAVNTGVKNQEYTNTSRRQKTKRERINMLLIGPPGLAKSSLLRSAARLVKNSRYESAQNSTGKSLTAIISKEDDMPTLRTGPVPQSRYAFCALNEIAGLAFDEQKHLLDIMEEGFFTKNAYGINATIHSPTTIIASSNPISTDWKDAEKINTHEIPLLGPLKDRFDLVFPFRTPEDKQEIKEYVDEKGEQVLRTLPTYDPFIIKYIEHAKRLDPKFTDEVLAMLKNYFVDICSNEFVSYRRFDTLIRISKARARLKLKEFVDREDAVETMQFYNIILHQYQQAVAITINSRTLTYTICLSILQNLKTGISLEELLKQSCEKDEKVKVYLLHSNTSLTLTYNKKIRPVYDMLRDHPNVKVIREKPTVLQWFDDKYKTEAGNNDRKPCDLYDLDDLETNTKTETISKQDIPFKQTTEIRDTNQWSYRSDRSDSNNKQLLYCNYCDNFTSYDEQEIVKHSINKHPRKVALPTRQMLEHDGLSLKGNPWE
ncbi:MAG: hypothetical protein DA329_12610, partial [Candidatus Nitrosocosmicus sp.]|nr:hypothetical protein [Candidatus Nitrosocosmicus sp.]